jgi:hypothetical protein
MVTIRHAKIFNIAVDGNAAIVAITIQPKLIADVMQILPQN